MKNFISTAVIATTISALAIFFSCDRGGGGSRASGSVALYLTDDISMYSQVTATINRIQLLHTGTSTACDVMTEPAVLNIANLADSIQLINVTECPADSFNRIHIEFDKKAQLMDAASGSPVLCSFVSYKNEAGGNQPNVLDCDPETNICSLDISGAVNVLGREINKLALDFDLKDFEVTGYGASSCAATMKVSPLSSSQLNALARKEAITGIVSRLSTTERTFDLAARNIGFTVLYPEIKTSDQPGIDILLLRAQEDGLKTRVTSSGIDLTNNRINASEIVVKVEGNVFGLLDSKLSIQYASGGVKNMTVDFSSADVSGILTDGSWVEVKLSGYSATNNDFIANKIEVTSMGLVTEN